MLIYVMYSRNNLYIYIISYTYNWMIIFNVLSSARWELRANFGTFPKHVVGGFGLWTHPHVNGPYL